MHKNSYRAAVSKVAVRVGKQYIFDPIGIDRWSPMYSKGDKIQEGTIVTVTKTNFDPSNKFAWIEDEHGNFQSVDKRSLKPVGKR